VRVNEYRQYAQECLRWAGQAKTEDQQKAFLEMAQAWTMAALRLALVPETVAPLGGAASGRTALGRPDGSGQRPALGGPAKNESPMARGGHGDSPVMSTET
jgi:hypothetical protein